MTIEEALAELARIKNELDSIVPHEDRHPNAKPKNVARINELFNRSVELVKNAEAVYGAENTAAIYDEFREIVKIAPPRRSH